MSEMIGAALVIDEAMTIRQRRGNVSEATWPKTQNVALAIANAQAHALCRSDAIAWGDNALTCVGVVVTNAPTMVSEVQEWLAVLLYCDQLLDSIGFLEPDRALD